MSAHNDIASGGAIFVCAECGEEMPMGTTISVDAKTGKATHLGCMRRRGALTPTEMAVADVHQLRPGDGEFYVDDWLWLKQYALKAGEMVAQHVHMHDHVTVVAVGTVRLTIDGVDQGEIVAPRPVSIRALAQHSMVAVTDALIFCVHNLRGEGYPALVDMEG
jgi:hypothetical protein